MRVAHLHNSGRPRRDARFGGHASRDVCVAARRAVVVVMVVGAACSGGAHTTERGTPSGRIDVSGTVLNAQGGVVSGAKVGIGTRAVVVTGADGRFALKDVDVPFTASVVSNDNSAAGVFVGVVRSDVSLRIPLAGPPPTQPARHTSTLTGHLSGGAGYPQPGGHETRFLLTASGAAIESTAIDDNGNYSVVASWAGAMPILARLHAVQFATDSAGQASAFDGMGSVSLTLAADQVTPAEDIPLAYVANARMSGVVSVATGYTLFSRTLRALAPPSGSLLLAADDNFSGSAVALPYDYACPTTNDIVLKLTASALDASTAFVQIWRSLATPGHSVELVVPAAPVVQLPFSPVAVGSVISLTTIDGAAYDVTFSPATVGSGPALRIVTDASSVTVPDLSSMGLAWPASRKYRLDLTTYAPVAVEDLTGGSVPTLPDGIYAASAPVWLTTSP
jgi:hypothetical protein